MSIQIQDANTNTVEIRRSKGFLVFAILGSLSFCCLGVFVIWPKGGEGNVLGVAFVCFMVGFFALCAANGIRLLFKTGPVIVISDTGFSLPEENIGPVAWTEVTDTKVLNVKGNLFLSLAVRDPQKALSRCTLWQTLLTKLNQTSFKGLDVTFPLCGYEQSAEEIVGLINSHLGRK